MVQIQIGTILKPQGLKGAVKISFEAFFLEWLLKNEFTHLYIAENGAKVPYFVETVNINAQPPILKLEGIEDRNAAMRFKQKAAFLEESLFEGYLIAADEVDEWEFLKGFMLKNADLQKIGSIKDVLLLPGHELVEVNYQGREVLIPLNEALIIELDETNQVLVMEVAEGLLDI